VNNDEYVVYYILSSQNRIYGDGKAMVRKYIIDFNYYYVVNHVTQSVATDRINAIENAFTSRQGWGLANGQQDLYEDETEYRGINIEVSFLEVKNGKGIN
jgi:hypothetical protein